MEKSENYYKRQEYMQELKIPTFTEIHHILGQDLGDAVIDECPEVLKCELGTEPKLNGAGDTLWTSPSDLLKGIVVLKPPFTNRYIKALTHEGILSIGATIEDKFRNEMEEKCKQTLVAQEEMLVFIAEQERIKAVRDALAERIKYYDEKFASFENDFENRLQEELELLTMRLLEDNKKVLQTQKEDMEVKWQDRLIAEIEETTTNLTIKFLNELDSQEAELTRKYAVELKKIEVNHETTLQLEQSICKETLKQLKHNLKCKNISNLIYVICMERRKCEYERTEIELQHNDLVSKLSKQVETSMSEIKTLQNALSLERERITIKDRCLQEILKQFQKFVYFALKAAPKQGEFLLNIEKLLLYELAETVINLGKKSAGSPVSIPKRLPPKQKELIPQDLTLPPYHNCLDELDLPEDSSEELFSVIFNDKLYVREDFRNMISQGIEIEPTNELWNKDVEELIAKLKTSIEDISLEKKLKQNSISKITSINTRFDRESRRSSVHFVDTNVEETQVDQIYSDVQTAESDEQKNLTECILQSNEGDETNSLQLVEIQKNNSILLCVKDSLEHHRMSLRTGSLRDDISKELVDYTRKNVFAQDADDPDFKQKSQHSSRPSSFLEKIRKIHEESLEGKPNIVEVNQTIENKLPNNLIEEGILNADEIMPKPKEKRNTTKVKDFKQQHSITPKERRFSGLSMTQDSIEIIKSSTLMKSEEMKKSFKKAIMEETTPDKWNNQEELGSHSPNTCSMKDEISIIEPAIKIGDHAYTQDYTHPTEKQVLTFNPLPKIDYTGSIKVNPDQTRCVYEHLHKDAPNTDKSSLRSTGRPKHNFTTQTQRDNFLKKENIAEITGNEQEIKTCTTAFTADRVHSLIKMLKEDPSLMRIFTACSR